MLLRQVGRSLVASAPAKLNLFLDVLGKRPDGYHELETLMVAVDLCDTLTFRETTDGTIDLVCRPAFRPDRPPTTEEVIPSGDENLVVKAARLLREQAGVPNGARIELVKRIPAAAGLAGGSSDAAATLLALNRLWKLGLSREELLLLGARLGSDVAFFVAEAPAAVCRGRGEIIEAVDIPAGLSFVLARPWSGLSTALVFRHCQVTPRVGGASRLVDALRQRQIGLAGKLLHNSLEEPARRLNGDVELLKRRLARLPVAGSLMSGSGTACFGLCFSREQARSAAARLRAMRIGRVWTVQMRP